MKREYNEEYVERAIDMCKKLAWKFARGNYDLFEEYLSEAYIGATKALNTYDENSGIQFSTYCKTFYCSVKSLITTDAQPMPKRAGR